MVVYVFFYVHIVDRIILAGAVFEDDAVCIILTPLEYTHSQNMEEHLSIRLACYAERWLKLSGELSHIHI